MDTPMGCRVVLRATRTGTAYLFTDVEFDEFRRLVDGTGLLLEVEGG